MFLLEPVSGETASSLQSPQLRGKTESVSFRFVAPLLASAVWLAVSLFTLAS